MRGGRVWEGLGWGGKGRGECGKGREGKGRGAGVGGSGFSPAPRMSYPARTEQANRDRLRLAAPVPPGFPGQVDSVEVYTLR